MSELVTTKQGEDYYTMEVLERMYALEDAAQKTERLKRLAEYDAAAHITEWEKYDKQSGKNVRIRYYPAGWRLYELNLRYPYANFDTDIVMLDVEKDMVIIKCRLFLGPDYASSPKKATALKQGRLSILDKIETLAKARCARDVGVGTEYALDMEDTEAGEYIEGRAPNQGGANGNQGRRAAAVTNQPARPALATAAANSNQGGAATTVKVSQPARKPEASATSSQEENKQVTPLNEIPTVSQLRARAAELNLSWNEDVLPKAMAGTIAKGNVTLKQFIAAGNEIHPDACKVIARYLQKYALAQTEKEAS